jgi:predicted outer membrane repeat protein
MYDLGSAAALTNVTFIDNEAESGGGMLSDASVSTLTNVTFNSNTAVWEGGGLYNNVSFPTLMNVIFISNEAISGGGLYNSNDSFPTLTNVTFSSNTAVSQGGGIFNSGSEATLTNTVIWGNTAGTDGNEIYNLNNSTIELRYSLYKDEAGDIVMGNGFTVDTHSLTDDPLFVDAAGGDLHLQDGSPAIDSGDNAQCPATDRQGGLRPVDGDGDGTAVCDMGAFEYGSSQFRLYLPTIFSSVLP